MWAAQSGHLDIVTFLKETGADFNLGDYKNGYTAMMLASQYNHMHVVTYLVQAGADINTRDRKDGRTAMIIAVIDRRPDTIAFLIKLGADVDVRDDRGRTAIATAALYDRLDIVLCLQKAGANCWLRDNGGKSAKDHAWTDKIRDLFCAKRLAWLRRCHFLMFLATQSFLIPALPHTRVLALSREEVDAYYLQKYSESKATHTPVHTVFHIEELIRHISSFL